MRGGPLAPSSLLWSAAASTSIQFRHWVAMDLAEGLLAALLRQLSSEEAGSEDVEPSASPAALAVRALKAALGTGMGGGAGLVSATCQVLQCLACALHE
jgi:hypothetical protein